MQGVIREVLVDVVNILDELSYVEEPHVHRAVPPGFLSEADVR